jgi:hypothetical protein
MIFDKLHHLFRIRIRIHNLLKVFLFSNLLAVSILYIQLILHFVGLGGCSVWQLLISTPCSLIRDRRKNSYRHSRPLLNQVLYSLNSVYQLLNSTFSNWLPVPGCTLWTLCTNCWTPLFPIDYRYRVVLFELCVPIVELHFFQLITGTGYTFIFIQ